MSNRDQFARMAQQVDEIHSGISELRTVVLGVGEQGGLYRQVQTHEKAISELKGFRARLTGVWIGVSAAVTLAGVKLFDWLKGGGN